MIHDALKLSSVKIFIEDCSVTDRSHGFVDAYTRNAQRIYWCTQHCGMSPLKNLCDVQFVPAQAMYTYRGSVYGTIYY